MSAKRYRGEFLDSDWSNSIAQRVDVAKSRVESLNPLVTVETLSHSSVLEGQALDDLVQAVDLVCVTDWARDGLLSTYGSILKALLSVITGSS